MLDVSSSRCARPPVQNRAWKYELKGIGGAVVPVYLLDADLPEISEWDRKLTHYLSLFNVLVASLANQIVRRGDASAAGEAPMGGAEMLNMTCKPGKKWEGNTEFG
jgi:hypothetical protein